MKGRASRSLLCLAATGALALGSQLAYALEAKLDTFQILKNGAGLVLDTFADGAPPPSADTELATYLYSHGGLSETSGLLTLNASTGPVIRDAVGDLTKSAGATFSTNIGTNSALGLRSSNTLRVSAVFDLLPVSTVGDGYGIRLTDRNQDGLLDVGTSGNDVLELGVFRQDDGGTRVVFRRQDFLTNAITEYSLQTALFSNAQIELNLTKSSSDTNAGIEASYRYYKNGGPLGLIEMAKTDINGNVIQAFHGEDWTRGEFFAVQAAPIPEPETYAMLLTGLALVGWQLSRKSRQAGATRIT